VTVHFEQKGQPMCLLLDLVEVAKVSSTTIKALHSPLTDHQSHSGVNLAAAFADILREFQIEHKVGVSAVGAE
jgi:hypothetical protein